MAVRERAGLCAVLQIEQDAQDRMVEQVLAHRPVDHDLYAERIEPGAGTNAGALQHRR